MSKGSIHLRKIAVEQMYGRLYSGLKAESLSPAVNIIFGSNAAGKTTLARGIELALWPDKDRFGPAGVECLFEHDETTWQMNLSGGRARAMRNGAPTDGMQLGDLPRECYHLPLHSLLEPTTPDFSEAVARQAAGGYDIRGAARQLGFKPGMPRRNSTHEDYDTALAKVDRVRLAQQHLDASRRRLNEQREALKEAEDASLRVALLDAVIAWHEADRKLIQARATRALYPDILAKVAGNEQDLLKGYRHDLAKAQTEVRQAEESIEKARQQIEASHLPEEGIDDGALATMAEHLQALRQDESLRAELGRLLEGARAAEDEAFAAVGDVADPDRLAAIAPVDVAEALKLAEDAEQLVQQKIALEEYRSLFREADPAALVAERSRVKAGIVALQGWLQVPLKGRAPFDTRRVNVVLVVGLVVSVIAAALAYPTWLALGAVVVVGITIAIALLALRGAAQPDNTDALRAEKQVEYRAQKLSEPEPWQEEAVRARLAELYLQHESLSTRISKAEAWERNRSAYEVLPERMAEADRKLNDLAARIGLEGTWNAPGLYLVLGQIAEAQKKRAERRGLEGQERTAKETWQFRLDALNALLMPFQVDAATDAATASGRITELTGRNQKLREARTAAQTASDKLKTAGEVARTNQERIEVLFAGLELECDDDAGLADLLEKRTAYRKACDDVLTAEAERTLRREALDRHPTFTPELLLQESETLSLEREHLRVKAADASDLLEKIHGVEAEIRLTEQNRDLQQAEAECAQARQAVVGERDKFYRSAVGSVLAEYVYEQTREASLPAVVQRARELFAGFTTDRYQLGFEDDRFAVTDNLTGLVQGLSDLSSGTRLQLLLAVRVAYLEAQEHGTRPPLILDETLANSDDARSRAMIEAILQLSGDRQVFYFTAQEDEVARWKDQAADRVHLVCLPGTPAPEVVPEEARPAILPQIPEPDSQPHELYGRSLDVPRWSAYDGPGCIHLWYLVEDPATLYRLMRMGYTTWGPLRQAIETGRAAFLGIAPDEVDRIQILGRAVEAWHHAWAIGRGKPVTPDVITGAGVTGTSIERVQAECENVDGDPARLIAALRAGNVKGLRTKTIDTLEQHLLDNGYLNPDARLDTDEIRRRVFLSVALQLPPKDFRDDAVDRLIARLHTGPVG